MIRLKNICKSYDLGEVEVPVLKNINLHVKPHEFVSILGPSGSGSDSANETGGFGGMPGNLDFGNIDFENFDPNNMPQGGGMPDFGGMQ